MENGFSGSLTKWFGYLAHKSLREFLQFSHDYGLTILQMNILMRLYYRGSSDVSHLVDTMQVTKGAASQMVERMVQLELVERLEDPADRRVRHIHLTDKGRVLIEKSIAARRNWLENIAERLSAEQQLEIMKSLGYLWMPLRPTRKAPNPGASVNQFQIKSNKRHTPPLIPAGCCGYLILEDFMSETMRMWIEISFNILYLIVIWIVVVIMTARRALVDPKDRPVARRMMWMFALLALGDSGHVGFRVLAYVLGGLKANPALVGLGALSTAYTVTLFYMLLVDVWRLRFNKPLTWFGKLLLLAGLVRLVVMAFPQNQWQQIVPPYGWSLFRNAFLVLQGLGVMFLILRDAGAANDRTFSWIGVMIACSYAFYTPVILWSGVVPLLGMLMIPKTCAYVAVAILGYRSLYQKISIPVTSQ